MEDAAPDYYDENYYKYIRRRRNSRRANGKRMRFFKQSKVLKELGIWAGYKPFHTWHPDGEKQETYKGPESHPDNPFFPAPSGGSPLQALAATTPAPLLASTPQKS